MADPLLSADPPLIVLHLGGTDETIEWTPDEQMWLDIRAYCQVAGITQLETLIQRALADFFTQHGHE